MKAEAIGDPEKTDDDVLLELLEDSDAGIRAAARAALKALDVGSIVEKRSADARPVAGRAGARGGLADYLRKFATHPDPALRERAAAVLEKVA